KEGYLRSERSLIQTIGRAARNLNGRVILYADSVTESMRRAIGETDRRRQIQADYNEAHGITPQTIVKAIGESLVAPYDAEYGAVPTVEEAGEEYRSVEEITRRIVYLRKQMKDLAAKLEFERAAQVRDEITHL